MLEIITENACIEFPVYDSQRRSLRHTLLVEKIGSRFKPKGGAHVGGDIAVNNEGQIIVNALEDISFHIKEGDRVGLIGANGAGKSTLLRMLSGVYEPIRGELTVNGKTTPLFDFNEGIDMDTTGIEAIRSRCVILGVPPERIEEYAKDIAEFTELGDYLYMPLRTYSTGMMVRLSFGAVTAVDPEILLLDELVGGGDAHFIDKAQKRMDGFLKTAGILVIATHGMSILRRFCNKAIFLDHGRLVEFGDVEPVIAAYERSVA